MDQSLAKKIHAHTRTGRSLGEEAFVGELEARLQRRLRPQKRQSKAEIGKRRVARSFLIGAAGELNILSPN